jgi:hypothetical protein
MFGFLLRPSPPLIPSLSIIAIYAAVCLLWIGFASGIAPNIIAAAYNERSLPILNWAFQGHTSLPLEHYLGRWNAMAAAVPIAMMLHLVIVLCIRSMDRKTPPPDASRARLRINFALTLFSAAFLALTALSWAQGDYPGYVDEWTAVLDGRDPWLTPNSRKLSNAYGPLFNALAPLIWINPLANKLLFAFSYLAFVIWLIKQHLPSRGLSAPWWPWLGLWLLNPFPWVELAYFGYFDVLVGLACVAAVHCLLRKKDAVSGAYLGLGVLLKYMPIAILPFLVLSERRLHVRLLGFCLATFILGFGVSLVIWGPSTFLPLTFAASRYSHWSIYDALAVRHSPLRLVWDSSQLETLDCLEKPLLVMAGLGVFAWCMLRRTGPALSATLAILVTLLFYRAGYINYQMVPFLLISYWVVSEWQELRTHHALGTLLGGYFGLLAILELVHWTNFPEDALYSNIVIFKFLLGCALFVGLVWFSARLQPHHRGASDCGSRSATRRATLQ